MANFYDVNAAIQKPNVLGAMQQGLQFGQQQRALREQRADQQQLRQLAPQVQQGDPSAFMQAAAIDPQAAQAQMGAGDAVARRAEGLVRLLEEADARDPREAQALWQAHGVPFARQFSQGTEPTTDWSQAKPMLQSLKARIAMAKSAQNPAADPTGFRELDMKARAAGYQPGTPEYQQAMRVGVGLQGRAASGGFGFEKVTGPDGRERMGRTNPRTGVFEIYDETSGDFVPMGGGAPLNGGNPQMGGNNQPTGGVNVGFDDMSEPQNQQLETAIAAMHRAGASEAVINAYIDSVRSAPRFQNGAGQPVQPPRGNPMLGVGPSPEARKYAEERGQQQAQVEMLGARGQIEAENARRKTEAEAQAKLQAENTALDTTKRRDAARTLTLLNEAEQLIPESTGSGIGNIADTAAGMLGVSTEGAQAIAALRTIAGQLTSSMPRMQGPQSDRDVQLYQQMAGDLANPNLPRETRMSALRTIRALNQKYADQPQEAPARQGWSIQRVP